MAPVVRLFKVQGQNHPDETGGTCWAWPGWATCLWQTHIWQLNVMNTRNKRDKNGKLVAEEVTLSSGRAWWLGVWYSWAWGYANMTEGFEKFPLHAHKIHASRLAPRDNIQIDCRNQQAVVSECFSHEALYPVSCNGTTDFFAYCNA